VGADDLPAHESFGGRRVLHLLGDRDPEAGVEELAEVSVEGVVGDPTHRCFNVVVVAAAGQGDTEHRRCGLGILEEQLVEVAHAVQEQCIASLALELQVLTEHGGHLH